MASAGLANTVLGNNKTGFIGGGQIGYNYTPNPNWLLGLEADFQGIAGAHSTASTGGRLPPSNFPTKRSFPRVRRPRVQRSRHGARANRL